MEKTDQFGKAIIIFTKYSWDIFKTIFVNIKNITISTISKLKNIILVMQDNNEKKNIEITKPKIVNEPKKIEE